VRRLALIGLVVVLAACGSAKKPTTTTVAAPPLPPGHVLYEGTTWAVSQQGDKATAYRLVGHRWVADKTDNVKIDILGPTPGSKAAAIPQIAFQLTGNAPLVDSALWVDGTEILTKGGGLTADKGTIYGAPTKALAKGRHVVVAYGRTANHGTAVAWVFHV
jgi:hypothetical protein